MPPDQVQMLNTAATSTHGAGLGAHLASFTAATSTHGAGLGGTPGVLHGSQVPELQLFALQLARQLGTRCLRALQGLRRLCPGLSQGRQLLVQQLDLGEGRHSK